MVDVDVAYLDSRNWEEEAMLERMRWLRKHDPVRWSEKDELWVISRFEDVVTASKDQATFTSGLGVRPGNDVKLGLIDEEEPRHGKLRGMINKGFTPRMVKILEETFRRITDEAIDAVAANGECEFVTDIAVPLPLRLIASMIGIREEDYDKFHRWSDNMIAADGNMDDPDIIARAGKAYLEYATYITPIIEERRKNPKNDLVSILAGAKDSGLLKEYDETSPASNAIGNADLQNDELIKLMVILMVAGNETTRNGISGGMQLLIDNPEARQRLIDDPSLIPNAVEEMVRVVTPVRSFGRTATCDAELGDQQIKAGQKLLLLYTSANRDERQFDEPDRFDIDRAPHHLGFGIGNHFCLGANLARMEMRVAFQELLRRLPDMEYAEGGPALKPSALVRTCAAMKLRFTPEA
ncbi:MAG: cytochrome P450 [Deltaproteobacteria bacterium]|nr:cytochrome P450 [Deltaproteobacteria bacterium]